MRRNSYQRTPARLFPSASTVWLTTIDSWSPKLRYCSRAISRLLRASMRVVVPGWGMHSRIDGEQLRLESYGAVFRDDTWVNVELAGVAQSVWNS